MNNYEYIWYAWNHTHIHIVGVQDVSWEHCQSSQCLNIELSLQVSNLPLPNTQAHWDVRATYRQIPQSSLCNERASQSQNILKQHKDTPCTTCGLEIMDVNQSNSAGLFQALSWFRTSFSWRSSCWSCSSAWSSKRSCGNHRRQQVILHYVVKFHGRIPSCLAACDCWSNRAWTDSEHQSGVLTKVTLSQSISKLSNSFFLGFFPLSALKIAVHFSYGQQQCVQRVCSQRRFFAWNFSFSLRWLSTSAFRTNSCLS